MRSVSEVKQWSLLFEIGIRGKVRLVPTHAMTFEHDDDPEPKDQAAVPWWDRGVAGVVIADF